MRFRLPFPRSGLACYEMGDEVARSGMSVVHMARRLKDDQEVAVKLMTLPYATWAEQLDARMGKGGPADLSRSVQHDNLVRTHEAGIGKGRFYVVMEYIDGPTLAELIDANERERWHRNRYEIILGIAMGLQCLHKNGLIHGDLSPDNVLLDPSNRPKIVDFGLALPARLKAEVRREDWRMYVNMAPEHMLRGTLNEKADIYSFGATAYQVLTGEVPFMLNDSFERSPRLLLDIKPVLPRAHDRSIPVPLEHTIMRCMAKKPARRFKKMSEVADAITRVYNQLIGPAPVVLADAPKSEVARPAGDVAKPKRRDRRCRSGSKTSRESVKV